MVRFIHERQKRHLELATPEPVELQNMEYVTSPTEHMRTYSSHFPLPTAPLPGEEWSQAIEHLSPASARAIKASQH